MFWARVCLERLGIASRVPGRFRKRLGAETNQLGKNVLTS
jgi:hypothetical protein